MYHILTLGTHQTLTWSGVNFLGPGRLTNDPIEIYACSFSKKTFLLQYSIKTCIGEVFECRLLNRCSRCTEKMHVRGWNCLYRFILIAGSGPGLSQDNLRPVLFKWKRPELGVNTQIIDCKDDIEHGIWDDIQNDTQDVIQWQGISRKHIYWEVFEGGLLGRFGGGALKGHLDTKFCWHVMYEIVTSSYE